MEFVAFGSPLNCMGMAISHRYERNTRATGKRISLIRRVLIGMAAFFAVSGLVVPPGISRAQAKKTLRVAFVTLAWNSEIPLRVALARGYFKSQGLQIEPIYIRGGPAVMAALVSGAVDFATVGGAQAVIRGRAHGLDVSIIGSISNRTNYVLLGNKQTRSVEALRGKIIGITGVGGFSEFTMRAYLKKQHIDAKNDVTLRAVGNTTLRATALEKGLISAAAFPPEDAVRLLKSGYPMIANFSESLDIPQSVITTRDEVLAKYPETSKRFLQAMILGIHFAKTNKKDTIRAGYDTGLVGDPVIVSAAYDLYGPALTSDLSIDKAGMQAILEEDISAGILDARFTVDKAIDEKILKQAQQELRAEGRLHP